MNIIIGLCSFILGMIVLYCLIKPKIIQTQTINTEIEDINKTIVQNNTELCNENKILSAKKEEITNTISTLQKYADDYYNKNIELANEKLEKSLENIASKYQQDENNYKQEYLNTLEDCANAFSITILDKQNKINELNNIIDKLQSTVNAAIENSKREIEKETNINFYRLVLSEEDVEEISKLRSIIPYLRNEEPLNKVIYKCYYEKPYTDLIGRMIGTKIKTGIYKITNIENNMCYIGKSNNIADRWKQHIKRGVGADTPTKNKLYPAMYKIGPENFTFEIIEECDASVLTEREIYWQNFFKAKEFGYSIK